MPVFFEILPIAGGPKLFAFLHPDERPRVLSFYGTLTPEKPFGTSEQRVCLPDGNPRWQQWNARALYDGRGRLSGYQAVGRDITERLETERSLRESEERYRVVAKHSTEGIVVIKKGRLEYVNDAFAYMCGHDSAQELIGKGVSQYIDEADQAHFSHYMNEVEAGNTPKSIYQAKILRPDGRDLWGEGLQTVIQWEGEPAVLATVRDITQTKLRLKKMRREANALRRQNDELLAGIKDRYRFGDIIGKSKAMQEVYEQILAASAGHAGVVIYGESGTGKELVAKAIHKLSHRSGGPFVPVNCGAIPEHLMESEFFGHEKGAFTGADASKKGMLDAADGGTLFLDEVGDIPIKVQIKLLRAIEGYGHVPLGGNRTRTSDYRIVAATNRSLIEQVKAGRMRSDFFFRIHIIPIYLPSLRERKEDIVLLVDHFLRTMTSGPHQERLPGKIMDAFLAYEWPGNVRELQNVLHRYLTMGRLEFALGWRLPSRTLHDNTDLNDETDKTLRQQVDEFEKQVILQALKRHHWQRSRASKALGLPRRTLYDKVKKHGIILPG